MLVRLLFVSCLLAVAASTRPRGVRPELATLYNPNQDFSCLDGSAVIPFIQVNDDYCDCDDGSDEPGTSACPEGRFFCENKGHKSAILPSSRVNDGICDCCDGSDEWESGAPCQDTCMELGRAAREAAEAQMRIAMEGYNIKLGMIQEGKKMQEERLGQLKDKENLKVTLEQRKVEKQQAKEEAEKPEKEALDYYRQLEEEEQKKKEEAEAAAKNAEVETYFKELDLDSDGLLTVAELQSRTSLDTNKDGSVSEDEAKFFMSSQESLDLESFKTLSYPIIKPYLDLDNQSQQEAELQHEDADLEADSLLKPLDRPNTIPDDIAQQEATPEVYDPWRANQMKDKEVDYDDDEEKEEEEDEEEDYDVADAQDHAIRSPSTEAPPTETDKYDPKTRDLIAAADEARRAFDDADREFRDVEREIRQIKESMEKDYGPDSEFAVLAGQCFDFTDNEYIYKFCAFDHSSQKSKNGGAETRLGSWGDWVGPENNKYSRIKHSGGQQCWNGPARSTIVHIHCGKDNQLLSVTEPNRCEYEMHFTTPAACDKPTQSHDEL